MHWDSDSGSPLEASPKKSCPGIPEVHRRTRPEERRLEGKLVGGAHVFTHVIDSVAGAHGCGVMTKNVVGQADARTNPVV